MKKVAFALVLLLAGTVCHPQSASHSECSDLKSLDRQLDRDGARYISVSEVVARRLLLHGGEDVVIKTHAEALVTGTVMVGFELNKFGAVLCPVAMDGPKLLQKAAVSAVASSKFKPYLLNGEGVAVFTTVHIKVTLEPTEGP